MQQEIVIMLRKFMKLTITKSLSKQYFLEFFVDMSRFIDVLGQKAYNYTREEVYFRCEFFIYRIIIGKNNDQYCKEGII